MDRRKYSEVRQLVVDMLKTDLLGPIEEQEVLDENPRFAYIVGMLAPQSDLDKSTSVNTEQEVDTDVLYDNGENYSSDSDDDESEPINSDRFKTPSSIGISFYVKTSTPSVMFDITWGDYSKSLEKIMNKYG